MNALTKIKRKIQQEGMAKYVLTLMTGTVMAQAVPLLVSPILTRLYSPEQLGVLALFVSYFTMLSVVSTGKYEMAIIVPKEEREAVNIAGLATVVGAVFSAVTAIVALIWHEPIAKLLNQVELGPWLIWLPLSVLLLSLFNVLTFWANRKRQYKRMATSRVNQAVVAAGANVGLGFAGFGLFGLIVGTIVGQLTSIMSMLRFTWKEDRASLREMSLSEMKRQAQEQANYPKYILPSALLNTAAVQLTPMFIQFYFNAATLGFFSQAQRVLRTPIMVVSNAFRDVFRQGAMKEYQETGQAMTIFRKTAKSLILIATLPFVFLFFFAPPLFAFVFGAEWRVAGEYAQILVPLLYLQLVTSPLSGMYLVAEKQKQNLYWQTALFVSSTATLVIGGTVLHNMEQTLMLFTASGSILYLFSGWQCYRFARGQRS